jgi:hypothetical protein
MDNADLLMRYREFDDGICAEAGGGRAMKVPLGSRGGWKREVHRSRRTTCLEELVGQHEGSRARHMHSGWIGGMSSLASSPVLPTRRAARRDARFEIFCGEKR